MIASRFRSRPGCWIIALVVFLVTAGSARAQSARSADTTYALPPMTTAQSPIALPRLGGYIQVRAVGQKSVGMTTTLNRARFSIDGALPRRFAYRVLVEMQAPTGARTPATPSLREAIVRWNPAPFAVTAGEFKTPFTREYLIPVPQVELADLGVVIDSLATKYDVGVMGEYAAGGFATLQVGVFNGEGANATANRDSSVLWVGRVVTRPLPQLALGGSATHEGPDSLRWGVDAVASQWGALVRAEYVTKHRRNLPGKDDNGWYLFESLRLVPRVQLLARQEDFQRPRQGVSKRIRGLAYGVNFDIAPTKVKLLLEFSRRFSGPLQAYSDAFIAQIQGQL
jgi:hypothetical protein